MKTTMLRDAAFDVGVDVVVVVVLGRVLVEVFVEVVPEDVRDEVEDDAIVGEGNDRDVLLLGTLQNFCARSSAVASSEGQSLETQSTISLVKRLLTQKQLTSTTLVQFAAELPIAKHEDTQGE